MSGFVRAYWLSVYWFLFAAGGTAIALNQTTAQNDKTQSTISYVLKHPFHTVTGISRQAKSSIALDGDRITAVQVTAPIRSFDSGNKTRDKDMLKVTEEASYPNVTFKSTSINDHNNRLRVSGQLAFHGVTKEIAFTAVKQQKAGSQLVDGEFVISLEAYKIKRPSIFGMKVKDDLTVQFHMVYPMPKSN